jgi:hypothetical protein
VRGVLMGNITKGYLNLLEEFVFNGEKIKHLEDSLYSVGPIKVQIYTAAPRSKKKDNTNYFFGLNIEYFSKASLVVFICLNNECAYKIPTADLKEWGLNLHDKRGLLTTIKAEDKFDNSWLSVKKGDNKETQININEFWFPLYKEMSVN